jgi:hypothetical protein
LADSPHWQDVLVARTTTMVRRLAEIIAETVVTIRPLVEITAETVKKVDPTSSEVDTSGIPIEPLLSLCIR